MNRNTISIAAVIVVLALGTARAEETIYHFGTSSQRTNITFESQTDFETVLGVANQISGTVAGDLQKGTGSISVEVPVSTLRTGIDMRDEHLRSPMWLNAEKFPTITFTSTSARRLRGNTWEVRGTFSLHGVSRDITVKAEVRPVPAAAAKAAGLEEGDWVRFSAPFTIKLSDFGVMIPPMAAAKVSDVWTVKLLAWANTRG
jgi:polyisoprenoid-binding protein YceI